MTQKNAILVSIAGAVCLFSTAVQAQHAWDNPGGWWNGHFAHGTQGPMYSSQEVSLDLFASYINPEGRFGELLDTSIRQGFWGGGAGVNYFFTPMLGIGSDVNVSSKPDGLNLVDQVVGDLIFRIPVGNSGFAPYIVGSGGRAMSPNYDWVYGGGVGLEFRFNNSTGIFSDGRFLWSDRTTADNRLLIRAGVRLAF